MMRTSLKFLALGLTVLVLSGCATTKPRKPDAVDAQTQIASLQAELQAKDQQIQDLQYQLQSAQTSLPAYSGKVERSSAIRVPGVTIADVQRALVRAGFDPGPVDGRLGKKTKSAIRQFQRKNHLMADGIVGERTWSLLK